jgi:5-methylcytosine-specific restriction endonuclease McrA
MERKKKSKIWSIDDKEFEKLIETSKRMADVLAFFGLKNQGSNFQTVSRRIQKLNLNCSHFLTRNDSSNFTRILSKDEFINEWLTKKSTKIRKYVKAYLIKFQLKDYKCSECDNEGLWNGKPLSLQLDHINGINDDNRIDNLRFLCPNCHSQTETYSKKNGQRDRI